MTNGKPLASKIAILLFIITACVDWAYIMWVKNQPIIDNAWFVITPLIAYFYFTFAIIAVTWMHYRIRLGLSIAYCVLMFGTAADVLSCSLVSKVNSTIEFMIIPLIVLNLFVVFYMAYNQCYFKDE